jgi:aspartate kinase
MEVFKFGGASVKDASAVCNVGSILSRFEGQKLIVVVSAMGKTTNKLEEIVAAKKSQDLILYSSLIKELADFHFNILGDLFQDKQVEIYSEIETIFENLQERFSHAVVENHACEYDQVVSLGEVISSKIVAAYLMQQGLSSGWVDARQLIQTDNQYQEAKVDWTETEQLMQSKVFPLFSTIDIIVTQGFIGHTSEGITTTLGREGSDYSAAIFAYCLNANKVTIWKDVPGMLNADPKYFENTVKLDQISFKEAIELSYYGASVIHPKTIKPLQNKGIPLFVKSFIHPEEAGTIIQESIDHDDLIPSFIVKKDQVLFSIRPIDFSFIAEDNLSDIFGRLAQFQAKINLMQNSALSFSLLMDRKKADPEHIKSILGDSYKVWYNDELELVTIRHYDQETIDLVTKGKTSILEQKTRHTIRIVLK